MKSKTIIKYHFIPTSLARIKKTNKTKVLGYGITRTLGHYAGKTVSSYNTLQNH